MTEPCRRGSIRFQQAEACRNPQSHSQQAGAGTAITRTGIASQFTSYRPPLSLTPATAWVQRLLYTALRSVCRREATVGGSDSCTGIPALISPLPNEHPCFYNKIQIKMLVEKQPLDMITFKSRGSVICRYIKNTRTYMIFTCVLFK
jgi:hypothetical protein